MITIKVLYENGDEVFTRINATFEEAQDYYLNKVFNLGSVNDDLQRCIGLILLSDSHERQVMKFKTGCIDSFSAFISKGFTRHKSESKLQHQKIIEAGIVSSPINSLNTFEKNGQYWLFDGWDTKYGMMNSATGYINAIDVTDIINGLGGIDNANV